MDMISKLHPSILETILCLLPIQEAVRTSILSREWRYIWTKIPNLAFIENTFKSKLSSNDDPALSVSDQSVRLNRFSAVFHVLMMHEGPLLEFTLYMNTDDPCVEIDHIILLLARKNTLKKFTLEIIEGYNVPLSVFWLRELTDLYLIGCKFDHQPPFDGFCSLTNLSAQEVSTSKITLLHLLSSCPLLTSLELISTTVEDSDEYTIISLFECIPVIEKLSVSFYIIKCFVQDGVPKVLPTALVHLKYLFIEDVSFIQRIGLPILFLLIKSSPNLEKLKLEILDDSWVDESDRSGSLTFKDRSDIWLANLNELEIINMIYRKTELDFVKLILAKSPKLKKARIFLCNEIAKDEELEISRILQCAPGASSVEIMVEVAGGSSTNESRSVM